MLPNGRTLEQASKAIVNAVQDTKEQTEKTPNKSRNGYKQGRGHEKAEIELTWRVPKDPLDSRTDEKLYKLLIELRHGRK